MKRITIAALIVLSAGAASAAPFGYQQQVESSELDPGIWEEPAVTSGPFTASNFTPSQFVLYESVDIEGSAEFAYMGQMVPSAVSATSGYEQLINADSNSS
jgi:hypothetical protein